MLSLWEVDSTECVSFWAALDFIRLISSFGYKCAVVFCFQ